MHLPRFKASTSPHELRRASNVRQVSESTAASSTKQSSNLAPQLRSTSGSKGQRLKGSAMLALLGLRRPDTVVTQSAAASGSSTNLDILRQPTLLLPVSPLVAASTASTSDSQPQASTSNGVPATTGDAQLRLRLGASYLPHPEKMHYGGEDAHFISDFGGGSLGVADGVGGWQESGINPADYSRSLMRLAQAYLEGKDVFASAAAARGSYFVDPRGALDAAHRGTKVPGSATCCVMQLDRSNNTFTAANLGDSGFAIYRSGQLLLKSKALQHYFDCPLQFGAYPEYVEATDTAEQADIYSIPLQAGDCIVVGTDGLWDNVYEKEILQLLPQSPSAVQKAAEDISALARRHAGDNDFPSPYTKEALQQGLDLPWWEKLMGVSYKNGKVALKQLTGGKQDDITVLVAWVDTEVIPPPPPTPPAASAEPATATAATANPGSSVDNGAASSEGAVPVIDRPNTAAAGNGGDDSNGTGGSAAATAAATPASRSALGGSELLSTPSKPGTAIGSPGSAASPPQSFQSPDSPSDDLPSGISLSAKVVTIPVSLANTPYGSPTKLDGSPATSIA